MGNCVGGKGKKDPTVLTEDEIKLLLENTKLNRAQINALHQNFLKECPSGKLTKKDFVKLFKEVHPSENKKEKADKFCEYVFKVIDTQGLGYISFNDFVLCFSLTSYGDFKQKCEFAFRLYDLDKDNLISKKEMTQVLEALYDLSGIVDRKKEKSPAKKVEEIMKKINAKTEADAKVAAEAAKAAEPAAPAAEAPAAPAAEAPATPGKKDAKKAPKDPKPKAEKKPAPAKPVKARDFINKDQFIDACSNDEALKKLFVDSIFNSSADSSAAAPAAAAAASVSICAPTININSPPLDAPAVVEITHSSHVEVRSAPVDASVSDAVAALSAAVAEAAEPAVSVQVAAEPVAAPTVEAIAEPLVVECRLITATLDAPVVEAPAALEVSLGAPEPAAPAAPAAEVVVVEAAVAEPAPATEAAAVPEVVLECSAPPAVVEVAALSAPDLPAVEVEVKPVEHAAPASEGTTTVIASETHTTTVNGVTTTEKVVTVTSSSSSSADASSVVEQINSVIDSLNNADIKVELKH